MLNKRCICWWKNRKTWALFCYNSCSQQPFSASGQTAVCHMIYSRTHWNTFTMIIVTRVLSLAMRAIVLAWTVSTCPFRCSHITNSIGIRSRNQEAQVTGPHAQSTFLDMLCSNTAPQAAHYNVPDNTSSNVHSEQDLIPTFTDIIRIIPMTRSNCCGLWTCPHTQNMLHLPKNLTHTHTHTHTHIYIYI